MNIKDVNKIINAIINTPRKNYTKEEAEEILHSCGILDDNGNIVKAYQQYITNKSRCRKCTYELHCKRADCCDRDKDGKCPDYKRDAPDGGYYG